jgi:hypothetical protein
MDKASFEGLVTLVMPHVAGDAERHALVEEALYGCPVLHQIDWTGAAHSFAVRLVQTLDRFGQCSGELAVLLLLRALQTRVGTDKQAEISAFMTSLDRQPGVTPMIDQAAAIGFLIEIGRWARNELGERWKLRRKQQEADLTDQEQAKTQLPALLQDTVTAHSPTEVQRTLDLIQRKRDAIDRARHAKLADREQFDRSEITQAAFEQRTKQHNTTIRDMLTEIQSDLESLGFNVARE